jgi:hypothetical protein
LPRETDNSKPLLYFTFISVLSVTLHLIFIFLHVLWYSSKTGTLTVYCMNFYTIKECLVPNTYHLPWLLPSIFCWRWPRHKGYSPWLKGQHRH